MFVSDAEGLLVEMCMHCSICDVHTTPGGFYIWVMPFSFRQYYISQHLWLNSESSTSRCIQGSEFSSTPTHHSFWGWGLTSAGFFGLEAGVPGLLPFLLEEQKEVEGPKQTQTLWLTETVETLKLTNLGSTHFHYQTCRCCLRTWDVSSCNILQKRGQTQ